MACLGNSEITIKEAIINKIELDDKTWLKINPEKLNLYDKESGNLIAPRK